MSRNSWSFLLQLSHESTCGVSKKVKAEEAGKRLHGHHDPRFGERGAVTGKGRIFETPGKELGLRKIRDVTS